MNIRKSIAGVSVALLVATGAFFSASAASATEEPCVPSQPYDTVVHHDAVGNPTITVDNPDYVPATPDTTTPGGFEKWNWTNPEKDKGEPAGPPPGEGWHDVGQTNDSKGNTPDTIIHQGNGYGSYFYFQTLPPIVVPGTPAVGTPTIEVTNPDYVAAYDETVHHDGVTCPPSDDEPIVLTINPVTTTQPTCDSALTYTVPEQDSHIKYELSNGVRPVPGTFTLGAGESVTVGAHVAAQYLVANGGDYAPASYSVTINGADKLQTADCYPKLETKFKHVHEEGTPDCKAHEVPVWDATYADEPVFDSETHEWVYTGHWEKISGEESTRETTAAECPVVVTPPVVTPPAPPAPQVVQLLAAPPAAPLVSTGDTLAQTGSNTLARDIVWGGAAAVLLLLGSALLLVRRARPRYRRNQG